MVADVLMSLDSSFLMAVTWFYLCDIWHHIDIGVSMVVADVQVPIWHQGICNYHNDWGQLTHIKGLWMWHHVSSPGHNKLTLNVRGPSYLGLTRSISWLLMPWLLTSPGHQQPWYWLCKIGRFLSYLRKDFNYLRHMNVEIWHKM